MEILIWMGIISIFYHQSINFSINKCIGLCSLLPDLSGLVCTVMQQEQECEISFGGQHEWLPGASLLICLFLMLCVSNLFDQISIRSGVSSPHYCPKAGFIKNELSCLVSSPLPFWGKLLWQHLSPKIITIWVVPPVSNTCSSIMADSTHTLPLKGSELIYRGFDRVHQGSLFSLYL